MTQTIHTIGIAGAGTMGSGIAQVCATAGFPTIIYDLSPTMLEKARKQIHDSLQFLVGKEKITSHDAEAIASRITYSDSVEALKADLIIEAIIERLDIKQELFRNLEKINAPHCILATNTSSIPVTQIAAGLQRPNQVIGIHFFNPANVMKLVEIISGAQTSTEIANQCREWVILIGKTPVMAADAPGFIVNRVARHFYVEGLKVLEEQITSFENIDTLLEASGFKMGPFKLMDLIGVDTNYSVTKSMFELFNYENRFRPNRIQKQKVDAGLHGRKTGKGFYSYEK